MESRGRHPQTFTILRRRPANKTEDHNQRRQKLWHKEISPDCAIAPQVALL
jgi:hypothetical protein